MSKKIQIHKVEVVNQGERIILPERMTLDQAIQALQLQKEQQEEIVAIQEVIDTYPSDGAHALMLALQKKYGWTRLIPTPDFFGPIPPTMVGVAVSATETVQVPWGRMQVPGIDGFLETDTRRENGRLVFVLGGQVKRKHEKEVKEIADLTRQFARTHSIYRGKAIRVNFSSPHPQIPAPEPKFMDLSNVREEDLVFPRNVERAIRASIWNPIEKANLCRREDIRVPLKRGVLLAGPYGVGKTLAANVTAKKAERNGWTFIYADVEELEDAVRFALQYGPAVIFAEDLDRIVGPDRTDKVNDILNIVDGIESKNAELLIVLTTNHVEEIHPAMLRPGRLDAVIRVNPPDADAAVRLVRLYGRGLIDENEDLSEVGRALAGQIPAVIREAVERAKLYQMSEMQEGDELRLTASALLGAAEDMAEQLQLLQPKAKDPRSDLEKLGDIIGKRIAGGIVAARDRGVDLDALAAENGAREPRAVAAGK